MEYIGSDSLYTYMKNKSDRRLPEAEAKKIYSQLLSGVSYMHLKNVAHRDLKLENILLGSGN